MAIYAVLGSWQRCTTALQLDPRPHHIYRYTHKGYTYIYICTYVYIHVCACAYVCGGQASTSRTWMPCAQSWSSGTRQSQSFSGAVVVLSYCGVLMITHAVTDPDIFARHSMASEKMLSGRGKEVPRRHWATCRTVTARSEQKRTLKSSTHSTTPTCSWLFEKRKRLWFVISFARKQSVSSWLRSRGPAQAWTIALIGRA